MVGPALVAAAEAEARASPVATLPAVAEGPRATPPGAPVPALAPAPRLNQSETCLRATMEIFTSHNKPCVLVTGHLMCYLFPLWLLLDSLFL